MQLEGTRGSGVRHDRRRRAPEASLTAKRLVRYAEAPARSRVASVVEECGIEARRLAGRVEAAVTGNPHGVGLGRQRRQRQRRGPSHAEVNVILGDQHGVRRVPHGDA